MAAQSEAAIRISSLSEIDHAKVCYWFEDGDWWIYLPKCGAGRLSKHTVQEHEDGTITVSPSIALSGHSEGSPRHGYLERGQWKEC